MTTVKVFHSGMTGAPVLNGVVGSLVALLDACLVNGFGLGTVDSVVIAGGIGTVTRSAGHPFEVGAIGLLSGATVSGGSINGERRVLSTTVTAWTFDATGISDQTATGTITQKLAPAGWAKTYSGTNLAAYKSSDVSATGCLLRVDDTAAQNARVIGYESMADVNTGTGPFPTEAQLGGGGWWGKSNTADSTARPWTLVSDGRAFYLAVQWIAGFPGFNTYTFGDLVPYKSGDAWSCVLSASGSSPVGSQPGLLGTGDLSFVNNTDFAVEWVARAASGVGSSVRVRRSAYCPMGIVNGFVSSGGSSDFLAYPNPADNGLYVAPLLAGESAPNNSLRGAHAGCYFVPQYLGTSTFAVRDPVTGVSGLTGRTLRALPSSAGALLIDCTGPWR